MVLKEKDSLESRLRQLEHSLKGNIPNGERWRIEKDLAGLRSGIKGEEEAAYHIDFHLKNLANWAVIHDLRLDWKGRVAQIDHVLIDCYLEIYVIESKNFRTKVRCANGGWERLQGSHWQGIASPVEQNERHIKVLKEVFEDLNLTPSRLGFRLTPTFVNVVLVAPDCSIIGQIPEGVRVFRMDSMVREIQKEAVSFLNAMKRVSSEVLEEIGAKLAAEHKPAGWSIGPVNDALHDGERGVPIVGPMKEKNFGANHVPTASTKTTPFSTHSCETCGGALTKAEVFFCRVNKNRFAGNMLCQNCQQSVPRETVPEIAAAKCVECGASVDCKVVAFCRFKSKEFGKRVLCRKCQQAVLA